MRGGEKCNTWSSHMLLQVGREEMQPPRPLPWYPRKLAWQMDASRAQLRKLDALTAVHEFMKRENDSGGITRQEAVSMVPPLFLDVQPHHRVGPLGGCCTPQDGQMPS